MTEEGDTPEIESQPEAQAGPVGGERLAEARRARQISVLEVAKELHLDEPKVRALERNDFEMLGAAVFAKGHLRKYAQLVGVDEADVFADYYKMTHTAELPPVVIRHPKVRKEISPGPWIAAIIVILAAAAAYWWFAVRAAVPQVSVPAGPAASLGDRPVAEGAGATTASRPEITIASAREPREEATAPASPAGETGTPPSAGDDTRIELSFRGDCWTEISDATGRRLFFGMGRAGRTVDLAGTPPFDALFGNAANVGLRVDGADRPVTPDTPGGRTARLTILEP
jgi:cytoskeleton protein RodZ